MSKKISLYKGITLCLVIIMSITIGILYGIDWYKDFPNQMDKIVPYLMIFTILLFILICTFANIYKNKQKEKTCPNI